MLKGQHARLKATCEKPCSRNQMALTFLLHARYYFYLDNIAYLQLLEEHKQLCEMRMVMQ